MSEEVMDVVREIQAHGVTILLVEQNVYSGLSIAKDNSADLLGNEEVLRAYLGG